MSVLAYIDGSRFTESVCQHAAWAARQLGTGVMLVHVLDYVASNPAIIEDHLSGAAFDGPEQHLPEIIEADRRTLTIEEDDRRETLLAAARDIRSQGVEKVQTALEFGTLEDHIREHGRDAHLAVLGKRGGHSADRSGTLGDHLERVIRAAPCPVLIAPSEPQEIRRYMIAFDGGPQSGNAIRFLVEQPLLKGYEGTLLLVSEHPGVMQQLDDAASRLRGAGYQIQAELGHGPPERLIPDILNTEDLDLLIMGAFGHSRLQTLLGRSTTRKLLRASSRAILVIR